jgi:hypothetical protein
MDRREQHISRADEFPENDSIDPRRRLPAPHPCNGEHGMTTRTDPRPLPTDEQIVRRIADQRLATATGMLTLPAPLAPTGSVLVNAFVVATTSLLADRRLMAPHVALHWVELMREQVEMSAADPSEPPRSDS